MQEERSVAKEGVLYQSILSYTSQQLHPCNSARISIDWIDGVSQAEYRMLSTPAGFLLDGEGKDRVPLNVVG